jgi:hypothetical protein
MRNLRLRQVPWHSAAASSTRVALVFAWSLAALLAVPALLAGATAAPPASEEYDLELPSDPDEGETGGTESAAGDSVGEPAPDPVAEPSGEPPDPTGGASADGDPAGGDGAQAGANTDGDDELGKGSQEPTGFEPKFATGVTAGNPGADRDFPTLAVALAAAAVLAVPAGIWLTRRRRA